MPLFTAAPLYAGPILHTLPLRLDHATPLTIGLQLPITDDEDRDARVFVKYRKQGTVNWLDALELMRVHPEDSLPLVPNIEQQFAGSIFNLTPNTAYEIQLTPVDPDGMVNPISAVAATRALPLENPPCTRTVPVANKAQLEAALLDATKGDCIVLAPGPYEGPFSLMNKSGEPAKPIVIRGTVDQSGNNASIIQGGATCNKNCVAGTGCNGINIRGSHVYLERIAFRNANKGIQLINPNSPSSAATGNVVRRVTMSDVCTGIIGVAANVGEQTDFYVCDNDLLGPITPVWPKIHPSDGGAYASTGGIQLPGIGHVICHNRIRAFGDAIRLVPDPDDLRTTRALDIYGNDIRTGYDNGIELDYAQGNVRAFRNRLLNTYAALSFQPIYGGPAYAFRNVAVNIAREQLKFNKKEVEPSGMLVFHNTFVSPPLVNTDLNEVARTLNLITETGWTAHNFRVENNIFFGATKPSLPTANWKNLIDQGLFDFNGYFPDGPFNFPQNPPGLQSYANLAALRAGTNPDWELGGLVLPSNIFASGFSPLTSWTNEISTIPDLYIDPPSAAMGRVLANINDAYIGGRPEMGALESHCPNATPMYGPRPAGVNELNEPIGCEGVRPPAGPLGLCGTTPVAGCHKPSFARQSRLLINQRPSNTNSRRLMWDWEPGSIATAELGNPSSTTSYALCVYQTVAGERRLVTEALIPGGTNNCGSNFGPRACWSSSVFPGETEIGKWSYWNVNRAPHGVDRVRLESDAWSNFGASLSVRAIGRYLSLPASLQLQTPITVQLRTMPASTCWDVDFTEAGVISRRDTKFYIRNY